MSEEIKGQRVTNMNGTEAGTDGSMVKFRFSGSPTTLYELQPQAGEVRVMQVTVQCTNGTHTKLSADGTYLEATWAIREAAVGKQTTLPETKGQTAIDDDDQDGADDDDDQLTIDAAADENDTGKTEAAAAHDVPDPFDPDGSKAASKLTAVPDADDEPAANGG